MSCEGSPAAACLGQGSACWSKAARGVLKVCSALSLWMACFDSGEELQRVEIHL